MDFFLFMICIAHIILTNKNKKKNKERDIKEFRCTDAIAEHNPKMHVSPMFIHTRPLSTRFVIMTIVCTRCCQIIRQNASRVAGVGPWVAMYLRRHTNHSNFTRVGTPSDNNKLNYQRC